MRSAMRTACIGARRRCTSTSISTSGPTASRTARTRGDRVVFVAAADIASPRAGEGVELHRGEAASDDLSGARRQLFGVRLARPAVGVDADALAAGAAQQLVHRLARALAADVPQRLLDAADRGVVVHGAASCREVVVHDVVKCLIWRECSADDIARIASTWATIAVAVGLGIALAPAVQAVRRLEPDEEQVLTVRRVSDVVAQVLRSQRPVDLL